MKIQTKERFVQSQMDAKRHQNLLSELIQHNLELEKLQRLSLDYHRYAASLDSQVERQKSYNSVVLAIGYAGFFALWAFLKDILPDRAISLTAILVGASLLIYVFWEIAVTAVSSFEIVNDDQREGTEDEKTPFLQRAFPYVWTTTVLFGFAGCILLFYNALAHFFNLTMWPS